ncbi:uncharacterized protein LOC111259783 isoform X1 [Varroa jacobsoni]|uniref:uncharacterized protein LOC111259783 isoform X1 n=1 Tax=Varroa jacobsoni TaxID=62625 RepID=UPI000BF857E0|nr:uncharacterized protein LOC111259783 isoform X1 [Varroa jacobsoni]
MEPTLLSELQALAKDVGHLLESEKFANAMDAHDELKQFRSEFVYPKMKDLPCTASKTDEDSIYLCGHSLGLMPKKTRNNINKVLDCWGQMGAEHHYNGYLPAAFCELYPKDEMARLAGCFPYELVIMNGLTVNLHLLMLKFYKPSGERYKIVIEEAAFPSDLYAVKSQLQYYGYTVVDGLIELKPRPGTEIIEEDDVLEVIRREGQCIALLVLPVVQYYTGQVYDIGTLTKAAHGQGCTVLCDAAHAIGNIPVELHNWDVDCAVWCSYKYLNSGAGGTGMAFVHERHLSELPAVHGWWGNDTRTKFEMRREFEPVPYSADSYKLSNCPPLLIAPIMASLDLFSRAGDEARYRKQRIITGYLEYLLDSMISSGIPLQQITPRCLRRRGSMICVKLNSNPVDLHKKLKERGVICDVRKPGVLRVTPCPLYNSFRDVWQFAQTLKQATTT